MFSDFTALTPGAAAGDEADGQVLRNALPALHGQGSRSAGDPDRPRRGLAVAELRGHERPAAEELGQWKTGVKEPKLLDTSPTAITLAGVSHDTKGKARYPVQDEQDSAGAPYIPPRGQPMAGSA